MGRRQSLRLLWCVEQTSRAMSPRLGSTRRCQPLEWQRSDVTPCFSSRRHRQHLSIIIKKSSWKAFVGIWLIVYGRLGLRLLGRSGPGPSKRAASDDCALLSGREMVTALKGGQWIFINMSDIPRSHQSSADAKAKARHRRKKNLVPRCTECHYRQTLFSH